MRICGPRQQMTTATRARVRPQVSQKLVRRRARKPSALNTSSMTRAWNATCGATTSSPSTPEIDISWCSRNKPGSRRFWLQPLA